MDNEKRTAKVSLSLKMCTDPFDTNYVVDEVSPISVHKDWEQKLLFGTGKLLTDFFTFVGNRKVIFVGDPAQLPPINTLFSPALNLHYVSSTFKKPLKEAFLYEVVRYPKNTGIYNIITLRKQIDNTGQVKFMTIHARQYQDITVVPLDSILVQNYFEKVKQKGFANAIMAAYSNAMCNALNDLARQRLFPGRNSTGEGDLAIMGTNNYLYKLENGQHIIIRSIPPKVETRANLHFRYTSFSLVNPNGISDIELSAKIIEESLYRPKPQHAAEEEHALTKDFFARVNKED